MLTPERESKLLKLLQQHACSEHMLFICWAECSGKPEVWELCRPWSAGGFTGRPELDTTVTDNQMLPGSISWTSPRNHIGLHPESLLYNRDPEQLAADVIGLSEKYAALANEHVSRSCPFQAVMLLPCALP